MKLLALAVLMLVAACVSRAAASDQPHVLVVVAETTGHVFHRDIVAGFPSEDECAHGLEVAASAVDGKAWPGVVAYGFACVPMRRTGPKT